METSTTTSTTGTAPSWSSSTAEPTTDYVREYVYGIALDEVVLEWLPDSGQKPFWPMIDSLGTVRDLADLDGSATRVRMAYQYNPHGALTQETATGGAVYQDVLFTGRWLDREMKNADSPGLYYYRAREYDPELGRFLQRDPIGVWGDGVGLGNGYAYVGKDSTNTTDSSGHAAAAAVTGDASTTDASKRPPPKNYPVPSGSIPNGPAATIRHNARTFMKWYKSQWDDGIVSLFKKLPNCPCCLVKDGGTWRVPEGDSPGEWGPVEGANSLHAPAKLEIRSAKPVVVNHKGKTYHLGQQCPYDAEGRLITHGTAAGTPDLGHISNLLEHGILDVVPYKLAQSIDEGNEALGTPGSKTAWREAYLLVRPPNNGNHCPNNP